MRKENTNLSLSVDIKTRANNALEAGYFRGSLTALVERALEELLDRNAVPKTFKKIALEA